MALYFSLATLAVGCGKSLTALTTSGSGGGVTVSGQLAGSRSELSFLSREEHATSLNSFTVDCVTLSGTASSCSGTCDTLGNFQCGPLPTGIPFGCFVEKAGSVVAVLAFTSTNTGLSGSNTAQGSIVAGSGTTGMNLGSITLNTSTGTAVVSLGNVQTEGGTSPTGGNSGVSTFANLEDANGWTIQATPAANLPPGQQTASNSGNGPTIGQVIFLAQYQATDGSSNPHLGMAIWDGGMSGASAMTAYNACTGSGGGEGANLPTGFSAVAGPNNNASRLTGSLNVSTALPNPANAKISDGGPTISAQTPGVCGITALVGANDDCTMVASETGFQNPVSTGSSVGIDECIFLCTLNDIRHASSGGCAGDASVNWSQMGTSVFSHTGFDPQYSGGVWTDQAGLLSFTPDSVPASGSTVSYLNGAVLFNGGKPNGRFMFGELIVSPGGIGTLSSQQPTRTETACKVNPGSTGCPMIDQIQCHVTELDQLTITETASNGANATAAVMQLTQNNTLASGDDTACASALASHGETIGQSIYMFNIVAN